MFYQDCKQTLSTTDIVNQSLKRWKDYDILGIRAQDNRPDTNIPLSLERLDMAVYTYSYHMNEGCASEKDLFWGNKNICKILLKYRFEEHSACHCPSCFKKGCKCRFLLPFMSTPCTHIHKDRGDNSKNKTMCFYLNETVVSVYPFIVLPKRPMGCHFTNAHNTQSQQFSIATQTSKLEMRCKFSTALCT